jgi:hypothetical protein
MSIDVSADTLPYFSYLNNEYGLIRPVLFSPIEDFANVKSIHSDDRKFLLSLFGYNDTSIEFDSLRDIMRREIRSKNSPIKLDEGLAFIRLCVLVTMFDNEMDKAPTNDADFKIFCLNHPLWPRIEKQAQITLALFKKNKLNRNN